MNKGQSIKNIYSDFIFYRTYSRWDWDKERRETWDETVNRYRDFWLKRIGDNKKIKEEFLIAVEMIRNKMIMPSMRLLWTAGKAVEVDNICAYNCSYRAIDDIKAFPEVMYILMNGTGVGVSVERQFVNKLPEIPAKLEHTEKTIVFEDSKLGWAKGFYKFLKMLYQGFIPQYDVSKVRPRGAILKTFGGRASGAKPLIDLLEFVKYVFNKARGRKLTSEECADIVCKIAEMVIVGAVRRSAVIIGSNLSDTRMQNYKNGEYWLIKPYRAMANISAVYTEKPSMPIFLDEWMSLIKSQSGERGIINREGFQKRAKQLGRDSDYPYMTNPCQPEFATVLTPDGIRTIGEIKVGDIIWSGKQWTRVVNKWETGIKHVYKYRTSVGSFIGTENHRVVSNGVKVEVKDAETIDISVGQYIKSDTWDLQAIVDGLVLGDGTYHKASNSVLLYIGEKDNDYFTSEIAGFIKNKYFKKNTYKVGTTIKPNELPVTYLREVPERYFKGNHIVVKSFLKGLFSANGSIRGNRVTLKQTSKKLIEQVQAMLSGIGIRSYITTNKESEVEFFNKTNISKENYTLNITVDIDKFYESIGFIQKYKMNKLKEILDNLKKSYVKNNTYEIIEVEYLGEHKVFDITVEADEHTYWTGGLLVSNCGEIILKSKEFCNLSEVVCRYNDDYPSIIQKVKYATLLGTLQATLDDFNFIGKEWYNNVSEERLLGVSLTGIFDCPFILKANEKLLEDIRAHARYWNRLFSNILGINSAKAVTCIKPSGTVSQLVMSSSGIHPAYAPYYIRRVRVSTTDPLCQFLMDVGIPNHPEVGQSEKDCNTRVFEFPIKHEGYIYRKDLTALQQLEIWKRFKEYYTDHNPSVTIYVRDDEWLDVGAWVYRNWDIIGGLSFLPYDGGIYPLAPYEEIDEAKYKELISKFPENIDFSKLTNYEKDDYTTGAKEYACVGGACEI